MPWKIWRMTLIGFLKARGEERLQRKRNNLRFWANISNRTSQRQQRRRLFRLRRTNWWSGRKFRMKSIRRVFIGCWAQRLNRGINSKLNWLRRRRRKITASITQRNHTMYYSTNKDSQIIKAFNNWKLFRRKMQWDRKINSQHQRKEGGDMNLIQNWTPLWKSKSKLHLHLDEFYLTKSCHQFAKNQMI